MITLAAIAVAGIAAVTPNIQHVVTIVDENHGPSSITTTSMPYLKSLGTTYAHTTHYKAVTHPSLPNYMAMTSGIPQPPLDCVNCSSSAENIFDELGSNWNVWAQSEPSNCYKKNSGDYAPRHTAAPYYTDLASTCPTQDIPLGPTVPAITSAYTFIAPDLTHDAHSGSLGAADTFLQSIVPQLMNDPNYTNGSTLIELTWDEGTKAGGNTVYTVFVHPSLHHKTLTLAYDHYSLLRLNEELLGLGLTGAASTATDLRTPLGF